MLLGILFRHLVVRGTLTVWDARGRQHIFTGREDGPSLTVRLHDPALSWTLLIHPRLYLGEAYMDGNFTVENGDIYDFLDFIGSNMTAAPASALKPLYQGFGTWLRWFAQYNPARRARRNVAHHYDLSDAFYDLFLCADRQYSCAYFLSPEDTLEEAQENKKRHLAAKLALKPGQTVLDIGSGWGGLALYLAQLADIEVTGITLSKHQLEIARQRADRAGLAKRVQFGLRDYRYQTGRFDRVVSVGMFEHVGIPHYDTFFCKLRDLLNENGVAVLHSIGRMDGPGQTNPWIRKYIFPGGYIPALSEVLPAIEKAGLWVTDVEVLRLHYAETLRHWRQRFLAAADKVDEIYDARFRRMWEFYLAASEMSFRYGGMMVFQIQLARSQTAVPLTRDYITDWERARRAREKGDGPRATRNRDDEDAA